MGSELWWTFGRAGLPWLEGSELLSEETGMMFLLGVCNVTFTKQLGEVIERSLASVL
jgi:hypothetical protein